MYSKEANFSIRKPQCGFQDFTSEKIYRYLSLLKVYIFKVVQCLRKDVAFLRMDSRPYNIPISKDTKSSHMEVPSIILFISILLHVFRSQCERIYQPRTSKSFISSAAVVQTKNWFDHRSGKFVGCVDKYTKRKFQI